MNKKAYSNYTFSQKKSQLLLLFIILILPNLLFSQQGESIYDDIVVRFDQKLYEENQTIDAYVINHLNRDVLTHNWVIVVSSETEDAERIDLVYDEDNQRFVSQSALATSPHDGASEATPGNEVLELMPGEMFTVFYYPKTAEEMEDGSYDHIPNFIFDVALCRQPNFTDSEFVIDERVAMSEEELPANDGKNIGAVLTKAGIPFEFAVEEIIFTPATPFQLQRLLERTNGEILDLYQEDDFVEENPQTHYKIKVPLDNIDESKLPQLRSLWGMTDSVLVSNSAACKLMTLMFELKMEGYAVSPNIRLQSHDDNTTKNDNITTTTPLAQVISESTSGDKLSPSFTSRFFQIPKVWSFMSVFNFDQDLISVGIIDQGFAPVSDLDPIGIECDVTGSGERCESGAAMGSPTVGNSFVGEGSWHGTGVTTIATGALFNNFFSGEQVRITGAGTGALVGSPNLYKIDLADYVFGIGGAIIKATNDGASVINVSGGFPCAIPTNVFGARVGICSPDGFAFCAGVTGIVATGASTACTVCLAVVPFGIGCDIVCGAAATATATVDAACNALITSGITARGLMEGGVNYALANGVPVVASSGNILSASSFDPALQEFFNFDRSAMRTEVVQTIPAVIPGVIAVGAVNNINLQNTQIFGNDVDIWAPGSAQYVAPEDPNNINSPLTINNSISATSGAAGYVSGMIANMMAIDPTLDPQQSSNNPNIPNRVRDLIRSTAYNESEITAINPNIMNPNDERGLLINPYRLVRETARPYLPDLESLGYATDTRGQLLLNDNLSESLDDDPDTTPHQFSLSNLNIDDIYGCILNFETTTVDFDYIRLTTEDIPEKTYVDGEIIITYPRGYGAIGARIGTNGLDIKSESFTTLETTVVYDLGNIPATGENYDISIAFAEIQSPSVKNSGLSILRSLSDNIYRFNFTAPILADDIDRDGIVDNLDDCPFSITGANVNNNGCTDADNDGFFPDIDPNNSLFDCDDTDSDLTTNCTEVLITCPTDITATATSPAGATVFYDLPTATTTCAQNNTPPTTLPTSSYDLLGTFGSSTYYLSKKQLNWTAAQAEAASFGGNLVVINTPAENDFITRALCPSGSSDCGQCGGGVAVHIGLTDQDNEGNFTWVNGDPVTYLNWANDYGCTNKGRTNDNPNNQSYSSTSDADYAILRPYYNGTWGDYNDGIYKNYVIEIEGGSGGELTYRRLAGRASGDFFPVGDELIIYDVMDACGNADTCDFLIRVLPCDNADGDAFCLADDCDDNDPSVPVAPGTTCDDGDPNNNPDLIAADGCTCEGQGGQPSCDDIQVSTNQNKVIVENVAAPHAAILIFTEDFNTTVFSCADWLSNQCNQPEVVELPLGNYVVKVQLLDEQWDEICAEFYPVTLDNTAPCANTGDDDNDGVCNDVDCAPNNPAISSPNDPCDDGDPNTYNDVIQEDCSCAGTIPTSPCEELTITVDANGFTIEALNTDFYALKINDQFFTTEYLRCANWEGNCELPYYFNAPSDGTYFVQLQVYPQAQYSNRICEVTRSVQVGNSGNTPAPTAPPCSGDGIDINQNGTADECENIACDHPDFVAMSALFRATEGDNWTTKTNWMENCNPCSWAGVTCNDDNRVEKILLYDNNVKGVLPTQISELTYLKELQIGNSALGGDLILPWEDLSHLEKLSIYQTNLTDAIPPNIGALSKLKQLVLYNNNLLMTLPTELANLTQLEQLLLASNQLVGQIPPEWSVLTNLQKLDLSQNALNGEIPLSLGDLTMLRELHLQDNDLNGALPTTLGQLTALQQLDLANNNLTETLPTTLGNLTQLQTFSVLSNQIGGAIPAELSQLTQLQTLNLSNNDFNCVPTEMTTFCGSNTTVLINNNASLPTNTWSTFCNDCANDNCAEGWGACSNATALAIQTIDFQLFKQLDKTKLVWAVTPQHEVASYELERSVDGEHWEIIAQLATEEQEFIDSEVVANTTYYRLQVRHLTGTIATSRILRAEHDLDIQIFPNPIQSNELQVIFPNHMKDKIDLTLRDIHGRSIQEWHRLSATKNVLLLTEIPTGIYLLETNFNRQYKVFKVIVQ